MWMVLPPRMHRHVCLNVRTKSEASLPSTAVPVQMTLPACVPTPTSALAFEIAVRLDAVRRMFRSRRF